MIYGNHDYLIQQNEAHFLNTRKADGHPLLSSASHYLRLKLPVEEEIPAQLAAQLLGMTDSLEVVWLFLIVLLLFVGMFMETLAAIMILVPVLMPIMYMLGADPTHVGIVVICALSIGFQTPPLGENLFVASGISGMTVEQIVVKVVPFTLVSILALLLIAYVPALSLWLPAMMGYD